EDDGQDDEDPGLDARRRRAPEAGGVDEGELAHRVEADRQRDRPDGERTEGAETTDREVEARHEVDRLDGELGEVPRLATPEEEEDREHHPAAGERREGQGANGA